MNLPNKLTLLRVILVPFFILFFYLECLPGNINFLIALLIFAIASVTDALDGHIARKNNLVTNFGKFMDPLADKILTYSAFCMFIGDNIIPAWILIVVLAREFIVSGIRTVAASSGKVIAAGMSGKIKTVIQMIAIPALLHLEAVPASMEVAHSIINIIAYVTLYASVVMTVYSGGEYVIKNKDVFVS